MRGVPSACCCTMPHASKEEREALAHQAPSAVRPRQRMLGGGAAHAAGLPAAVRATAVFTAVAGL